MKNILFTLLVLLLIFSNEILPQNGKPQYNIRCERGGEFIGNFKVELFPIIAPLHTKNFDSLVTIQFYDTTAFHRVVPNFVIQGGDPNSRHGDPSTWGFGDPSQTTVPAEFSNVVHARGIVGAARSSDINSATSQFYVNLVENSHLNGQYTAYGRVYEGMNVVDTIANSPRVPGTERPAQKIEMFITHIGFNNNLPDIPSLISPQDNQEGILNQFTFQWSAVPEGILYRLQIAEDSLFNNIFFNNTVGRNSRAVTGLEQGLKKYYWRVSANNGGAISEYSSVRSFTTAIATPNLVLPADSSVNVFLNPYFEWEPLNGATNYRIQIATAPSFLTSSLVYNEIVNINSFSASGLQPNTLYFWRVRGVTQGYEGVYSNTRRFTTGTTTSVEDENLIFNYSLEQNYPNPFNPLTTIGFSLPSPLKGEGSGVRFVSLKVYDVLGNEVATLVNENKSAGKYSVSFNGSKLSSGIYYYKLVAGEFVSVKKMILLK